MNPIEAAAVKRETAPVDAHEQAADNDSFFTGDLYTAPNGEVFAVPTFESLDDEQQERFNTVQHFFKQCDKADGDVIVPAYTEERRDPDGTVTVRTQQAHSVPGGYEQPYQKDGVLVTPAYNTQVVQALLGDEEFARFRAAGGKSSELMRLFSELTERVRERRAADPKSDGGAGDVEEVSD